jgi:hypothetical protein
MPDWTLPAATWPRRRLAVAVAVALLVACSGPGPAAPDGSPSAAALQTTSPSARPSTSSAGPDPDAGAAVDAFRAFVQTDQSFHLVGDMLMTVGDVTLQAAIASDVSDGDEQGTIDVRGPGISIRLSVVLVDGTAYLRVANRAWQTVPGATGFSNPLGGLQVEGLAPVDNVNVAGVRTHHLRVENPEGFNGQTLSGNTLTDLTIASSSIDIYITDDGVPLTAIGEFAGTGTFGGERGPVTAKLRYDFSKFGAKVDIVAPIAASP